MTRAPRKCRLASCEVGVTGTNLFCRPHYYALPVDLKKKLWLPLYGGTDNIRACLQFLTDQAK